MKRFAYSKHLQSRQSKYQVLMNIALRFTLHLFATLLLMTTTEAQTPASSTVSKVAAKPKFIAKGYTPQAVSSGKAQLIAPLSTTQPMRFTIILTPPHPAQLDQLIAAIQDPNSSQYRHFLSFAEWKSQFAPSDANVQAVEIWAKGTGFKEVHRFASNDALVFDGTVGTVQKAFQVTINQYNLAGQKYFANDRTPLLPAAVALKIDTVLGLSSLESKTVLHASTNSEPTKSVSNNNELPRVPQGEYIVETSLPKTTDQPASPGSVKSPVPIHPDSGGIPPIEIKFPPTYNYDGLLDYSHCCNPNNVPGGPAETTIAIIGPGVPENSDIQLFLTSTTMPIPIVKYKTINGAGANAKETTIDTEWAITTSDGFRSFNGSTLTDPAHVIVYGAGSTSVSDIAAAFEAAFSDNKARIASASVAVAEDVAGTAYILPFSNIIKNMTVQGWTVVAAAGDEGAYADCETVSVNYPASDPNVIAAGGTMLNSGEPTTEGTWTGVGCIPTLILPGGGGGGCSSIFAAPPWQKPLGSCANGKRSLPDMSLNAGLPQEFIFQGISDGAKGTSLVAPELAGFFAQVNSYLLSLGSICGASHNARCAPVGNPGAALYAAPTINQSNPYYDITDGGCTEGLTDTDQTKKGFCSGPGYDKATGLGSADLLQLAWAINHFLSSPDSKLPTISFSGLEENGIYSSGKLNISIQGGTMGIAGYSANWDTDPGLLPHTRDSSLSGVPQNPLATSGSLDLNTSKFLDLIRRMYELGIMTVLKRQ
jgi:subtilase family serine protease